MSAVADRRRLGCWSRSRDVRLVVNDPATCRIVVVNPLSDLSYWARWRREDTRRRLIFDFVDSRYMHEAFRRTLSLEPAVKGAGRNWLYGNGSSKLPIPTYGSRVRRAMRIADRVTCATPEQATFLAKYDIEANPILDCQEEIPVRSPGSTSEGVGAAASRPLVLLWEGQLATIGFLEEMRQGLMDLCAVTHVQLTVCTQTHGFRYANRFVRLTPEVLLAPLRHIRGLTTVIVPWSPRQLVEEARRADVAVLPVSPEDRASWLKPENRAVIMWRLGMPVVMSGTPAFRRACNSAGVDGLVEPSQGWTAPLIKSMDDRWRREQSIRGHRFAVENVSPDVIHSRWDNVLGDL